MCPLCPLCPLWPLCPLCPMFQIWPKYLQDYLKYVNDSKKIKHGRVLCMVYYRHALYNVLHGPFTICVTFFFWTAHSFFALFWRQNTILIIAIEWPPIYLGSSNAFWSVGVQHVLCLCPLRPKFFDTVIDFSICGHHFTFPKHTHHVLTRLFVDMNMGTTINRCHVPAHIHFDVFCIRLGYVFHVEKFAGTIATNNCKSWSLR